MSSTRSKVLIALAALTAFAAAWTLLAPGDRTAGPYTQGHVLDGGMRSEADLFNEHAQVGAEYWVSLPAVTNTSAKPVTLLDAELLHVPKGLKLIEYRAVSMEDTDGIALLGETGGKHGMPDIAKLHNYAGQQVEVKAHSEANVYYLARVRVTGKITGDLSGCRFRYRQGKTDYQQDLRCVAEIRLGPPLKIKD